MNQDNIIKSRMKRAINGSTNVSAMSIKSHHEPKQRNFKTKLCNNWQKWGYCRYGKTCIYAHGSIEIRQTSKQIKKYSIDQEFSDSMSDYSELSETYPQIDNKFRFRQDSKLSNEQLYLKYKAYLNSCFPQSTEILQFIQSIKEDQTSENRIPKKQYQDLSKRNPLFFDKLSEQWLRYSNYNRKLDQCIDLHCQKKVEALTIIEDILEKEPKRYTFITGKGKVLDEENKVYERKLYNFVKRILTYFQKKTNGAFSIEEKFDGAHLQIRFIDQ